MLNTIVTVLVLFYTLFLTQPLPDLDVALAQRLAAVSERSPSVYREVGRTANDDGAIIYVEVLERATGQPYPGVLDWIIGINQNANWDIFLPGDSGYTAAYDLLPPAVLINADSTPYKPTADPDFAPTTPYSLPFADGGYGTVTRSFYEHGLGQIDFDLTGRDVSAMKDGVIVYANDSGSTNAYGSGAWWYWNVIIIQHAPREYSLYGHLAPDSIPSWIKDLCTDDYDSANCNIPVQAGDVIALEGSSGYSSAPHLHVEFGQAYAVAAYMDTVDQDHDGIRIESIYGAYVYAEQNVPISGYSANDVADWQYGTVLQAAQHPIATGDANLIQNGDFSAGTDAWIPSGWVNWSVSGGVMRATRLRSADPPDWGGFYQPLSGGAWANTPFEITLLLGNDSTVNKTVSVGLTNGIDGVWQNFTLAANTPLQPHSMTLTVPDSWAVVRLMIVVNPADNAPAALIDDVAVYLRP